jgi:hypothetical protein
MSKYRGINLVNSKNWQVLSIFDKSVTNFNTVENAEKYYESLMEENCIPSEYFIRPGYYDSEVVEEEVDQ